MTFKPLKPSAATSAVMDDGLAFALAPVQPSKSDPETAPAQKGARGMKGFDSKFGQYKNQSWSAHQSSDSASNAFEMGVDRTWSIGSVLGIENEQRFSRFLGLDETINPVAFNPGIGIAGLRFNTGQTKLKAGLELDAGYGLGSFSINARFDAQAHLDRNGLSFAATRFAPSLAFERPYAYLNLDAVGEFELSPSLTFWHDVVVSSGETGNLLNGLETDVSVRRPLVDLDTRSDADADPSALFRIGALTARATVPRIANASVLEQLPPSLHHDSEWSQAFGEGVGYGISGSTTLVDLELSMGQVASYFGLPTTFEGSIWDEALELSGTLIDATVGIEAGLNYASSVAYKPNVYAVVEGSAEKYDVFSGDRLTRHQFADVDGDGRLSVTVAADPIIAANAFVSIDADVNAEAELLSARVNVERWGINQSWDVGPLWQGGPWSIASNTVELVDVSQSFYLSELAPALQRQLSTSFELPLV